MLVPAVISSMKGFLHCYSFQYATSQGLSCSLLPGKLEVSVVKCSIRGRKRGLELLHCLCKRICGEGVILSVTSILSLSISARAPIIDLSSSIVHYVGVEGQGAVERDIKRQF